MLVLAINTVGEACDVALVESGGADKPARTLAHICEPMTQGHDARLATLCEEVIAQAGAGLDAVQRIAVVVGPGSFTGVRVGVAFAHGLSLVLGVPAIGVTSLEALDPPTGAGRVLGLLPAKKRPPERSWWAQVLVNGAGEGEPVEADLELVGKLAADADAVAGSGVAEDEAGRRVIAAAPCAVAAAVWAASRLDAECRAASPVYVRAPDALPMAARHRLRGGQAGTGEG